jgi:hypothetical protein
MKICTGIKKYGKNPITVKKRNTEELKQYRDN